MGWMRKAQVIAEKADGSKVLGAPALVKQARAALGAATHPSHADPPPPPPPQVNETFELLKVARPGLVDTPQRRAAFAVKCLLSALEEACSDKPFSPADAVAIVAELHAAAASPNDPMQAVIEVALKRRVLRFANGFNPVFAGRGGVARLRRDSTAADEATCHDACHEWDGDNDEAVEAWLAAKRISDATERVYQEASGTPPSHPPTLSLP